jgi:hypothetical protein
MKKVINAMTAALGIRSFCGGSRCQIGSWKWYLYHTI